MDSTPGTPAGAGRRRPRKRRGGPRPNSGREANPMRTRMVLKVDPRDGITDELLAVSKRTGASTSDIAVAILLFNRGRYHQIAERMRVEPLVVGVPPGNNGASDSSQR